MKHLALTATAIALTTTTAFAGAIDRSGQFLGPLFQDGGETGQYVEFSFGQVDPTAGSSAISADPLQSFSSVGVAYKTDINERLSFALIIDEPFGADISLPLPPPIPAGLNGLADVSSIAVTGVGRYKFNENWSVHGGLRLQRISGTVQTLVGGGLPLANLNLASDFEPGLVAGIAYERPDIALRVALTYNSEIDNRLDGTETVIIPALGPSPSATTVTTPDSINLEFQSGIAADTLVFGSVRHVFWEGVSLATDLGDYVSFNENTTTYRIGVGRRFNENWSGAVTLTHERGDGLTTTLLSPTDGITAIGLGTTYTGDTGIQVTGGVTYGTLQDTTFIGNGATFDDNDVFGVGLRVGFNF